MTRDDFLLGGQAIADYICVSKRDLGGLVKGGRLKACKRGKSQNAPWMALREECDMFLKREYEENIQK